MSAKTPPEHPDGVKLPVSEEMTGIARRGHEVGGGRKAFRKKQVVARAPGSTSVVPVSASH
jgi:hypothetical protein